jgi:hypothetical protein
MGMTAGGAIKSAAGTGNKPSVTPGKSATQTSKPSASSSKFSVLEYITRDSSDTKKSEQIVKPSSTLSESKKRKHVSWPPEQALEQVKLIENITIKYAEDLFWNPPQEFGNARDLDIGEGHAFGKDLVEYDVEEEVEWYEPKGKAPGNGKVMVNFSVGFW